MAARIQIIITRLKTLLSKLKHQESTDTSLLKVMIEETTGLFESIKEDCGDDIGLWEMNFELLLQVISYFNQLILMAFEKVDSLVRENSKKKMEFENQREKLEDLESRIKNMETEKYKLVLGQVAFEMDKAVPKCVLGDTICQCHYIDSIAKMQKAIEGERDYADVLNKSERSKAVIKWKDIQVQLEWTPNHLRYMKKLKKLRLDTAHPPVNEETVYAALEKDLIPRNDRKIFDELFKMLNLINKFL